MIAEPAGHIGYYQYTSPVAHSQLVRKILLNEIHLVTRMYSVERIPLPRPLIPQNCYYLNVKHTQ